MDKLRIDSHKLIFHPERVSDWIKGKSISPIFLDVSPTSSCNHACIFCGLDYAHREKHFLKTGILKKMISDCAKMRVKSIMYAGEGEPLLHKNLAQIISLTKKSGIDASLNTNGVLLNEKFLAQCLKDLTWMRVSIDAGNAKTYAKLHCTKEEDFNKVLLNLKKAVELKRKKSLGVTIGTQFILLNQNQKEVLSLAKRLKKIGVDYLIVKPYSQHPLSINKLGKGLNYSKLLYLEKSLLNLNGKNFSLIFRKGTMQKSLGPKEYGRCLGVPFWAYISAAGEVFPCHYFLNVAKFSFGNLNKKSFASIWKGKKRKQVMNYIEKKQDVNKCRELCRLDEINKYLWELKNPHPHVNFI